MELAQQPEWKQILVDVVKKENIDPWDVNISIITDKFMIKLKEMKKFDFRIPANAILAYETVKKSGDELFESVFSNTFNNPPLLLIVIMFIIIIHHISSTNKCRDIAPCFSR